ncbi:MAG: hypothetical protein L6Q45_14840 [Anaerolineales bacterium]|nr:hypothetical protein [Anaerolineales bacterium]
MLYDGETPVPGVTVSPDGAMTIAVDGETVTLDPADVDFDDEKGITIKGYELTDSGWKAIDTEAATKERECVPVTRLEVGDRMVKVDGTNPVVSEISPLCLTIIDTEAFDI